MPSVSIEWFANVPHVYNGMVLGDGEWEKGALSVNGRGAQERYAVLCALCIASST